ncbi:MAG TPA: VOC family protein [Candidatus Pullichristensenella stercorigallinarum]|uniref:VOC family protein n=1 Tax=Candidatus Pullichristensenella stercorigallinarum TaxID=2840909 RepID=A0A9D0ZP69_9FIRM|nr:VOC family protein [Candidatus Pullichristensenella stercorigallinarum]
MQIDHIALCVRDLEAMRDFYIAHFGAVSGELYHNPRTGLRTYFLTFDGGARMELMQRPDALPGGTALREGWAHLCFALGSREAVDAAAERLRNAGCTVESGPRVTGDGYYESCVLDPEGNRVELMA